MTWEDREDEWTEQIDAAHPTRRVDAHEQYAIAMRMVGNRHSKHALVSLVSWLLVRLKDKGPGDRTCASRSRVKTTCSH